MKRRDIIAGLALAGVSSAAEEHETQSLYIPKAQLVKDRTLLHEFMDEYSFVDLVTGSPEIRITHIPVLLDRSAGKYGKLYSHISRQNPQSGTFDGEHHAVIVFRGPDAYISPTWYTKPEVVPTWNFAVVHASGRPKPITEKASLHHLLARLIRKFEGNELAYGFGELSKTYKYGLMSGIVGFEMEIERLEGKFKLGQERSAAGKERILRHLRSAKQGRSIHELTASFYGAQSNRGLMKARGEGPRLRPSRYTGSAGSLRNRRTVDE